MNKSGMFFRCLTILVLLNCSFAFVAFADEAWNAELVHRTACAVSDDGSVPLLWDVAPGGVSLYGDDKVIERFVPVDDGGFTPTGMFICDPAESMLALACNDEIALVGFSDGLGTFNFDEDEPQLIRKFTDGRNHRAILIDGDLAVTVNHEPDPSRHQRNPREIRLYDISDREDIELISRIEIEGGVYLGESIIVVYLNDVFYVYDISDPARPRLASEVEVEEYSSFEALAGSVMATVACFDYDGIQLYDLSDPDEPVRGASIMDPDEDYHVFWAMSGFGDYLVIYGHIEDNGRGISLYDVSDPEEPQPLRSLEDSPVGAYGNAFRMIDDELYVLFSIYDDADAYPWGICRLVPEGEDSYTLTHHYHTPVQADFIAIRDERLIMMDDWNTMAAWLDPPERPRFNHPSYYGDWNSWSDNIEMVSDQNWLAVDDMSTEGGGNTTALFRWADDQPLEQFTTLRHPLIGILNIDGRLALCQGDSWNIYDLEGDEPELIGETELPLSNGGAYRDGYLYCADEETFRVFNVEDLPDLELVAEIEAEGNRVFLNGDIAFVTNQSGLLTVDISNPEEPESVGLYEVEHGVRQMTFAGQTAYATTAEGLTILDVSSPEEIVETGYYHPDQDVGDYPESGGFGGIAINDDLLYMSGRSSLRSPKGLYVLRIVEDEGMQEIHCREGWSIISSCVDPAEPALEDIFSAANRRDLLNICKDGGGHFYWPQHNYNGIGEWDVTQAYWVAMESDHTLNLVGEPVPQDRAIPLRIGWNGAAYFPRVEVEAEVAFGNITDDLMIAKDGDGNFYCPERGFNNIPQLVPGRGYQVMVRRAVDLVWRVIERDGRSAVAQKDDAIFNHFAFKARTGANMSLLITTETPLTGEVGIFAGDRCVGGAVLDGLPPYGFAVWGDDQTTETVEGAVKGEQLTFRLWVRGHSEINLNPIWIEGDGYYITDRFAVLAIDNKPAPLITFELTAPYPNPFNSTTMITYSLPYASHMLLQLYDLSGRKISTLFEGYRQAGINTYKLNISGLSSGLYFVRLEAVGQVITRKVMLIR